MTNIISTLTTTANRISTRIESEENGQGLVEMSIVLCFLLCLTFGMIDLSRCIYTQSVVNAAAQEGVRAGIIDGNDILTTVEEKMIGLDMASAEVQVSVDGDIVEVEIAYDFEFVTPLADSLVSSLLLNGKASMVAS